MNKRKTHRKRKYGRIKNKTKTKKGGFYWNKQNVPKLFVPTYKSKNLFEQPNVTDKPIAVTDKPIVTNKSIAVTDKPIAVTNSSNEILSAINKSTLSNKAAEYQKKNIQQLTTATGTLYLGYGTVAGLSATGVGIPVAGALAAVLLITNKLLQMKMSNHGLKTVLYDVINIMNHCNNLNSVIVLIIEEFQNIIIKKKLTFKILKIDEEIDIRLKQKLEEIMKYLLSIHAENFSFKNFIII